jgi:hypothetical protein
MKGPGTHHDPHHASSRLVRGRHRSACSEQALARAFPFRNGFADSGRQGLTATDRGRQQDPFWPAFMLVNADFPR